MCRRAAPIVRLGAPCTGGALTTRASIGGEPLAAVMKAAARRAGGLSGEVAARLRRDAVDAGVELEMPVTVSGSRTLPGPLSVMVVLDVSGSTASSDPNRASFEAVRVAADWLASNSENERDRIGIVRFADRADSVAPVSVLRAAAAIDAALARSTDKLGGGTSLTPAIDELCRHLSRRHGRTVALVVTDGQVAEQDTELRALVGCVRSAADAVYVLALDHDKAWSRGTHRRYEHLGLNGMVTIDTLGAAHIAATIATVLVHEAGLATVADGTPAWGAV